MIAIRKEAISEQRYLECFIGKLPNINKMNYKQAEMNFKIKVMEYSIKNK